MSLIRTPEQTKLAELHAIGRGMLLRYDALQDDAHEAIVKVIRDASSRRRELLDAIADAARKRGDIPPAGDREINEVHALADRFATKLFGEETLYQRLLQAEESWQTAIDDALSLDWHSDERKRLNALRDQGRETLRALSQFGD